MRKSTDRILVTHVGSLPRGETLNELLVGAELGEAENPAALEAEADRRVAHVFAKQAEVGIDIANDGEQGRVGFQTYIPQRMSGFGGVSNRPRPRISPTSRTYARLMAHASRGAASSSTRRRRSAEVRYADSGDGPGDRPPAAARTDGRAGARRDCFMTAPSPGIIATTMLNALLRSATRII